MPDGKEEDTKVENGTQPNEGLEGIKAELETEKAAATTLKEAMAAKDARIAELEGLLNQAKQETQGKATELEASIAELAKAKQASELAIGKYREALILANPDIPGELIAGGTIDELAASVERGKGIVATVKKSIEAQVSATKVPAGAPPRQGISIEGLSPRELIAAGIKPKGGI